MRTLEQKISDAGPYNQRVDPHILTVARRSLERAGTVLRKPASGTNWYYLAATPADHVSARLATLAAIHSRTTQQSFTMRVGQALEIACYRALLRQNALTHFGAFLDLDVHDDSTLYRKEEPPRTVSGRRAPGDLTLDFIVGHAEAGYAGVEVKNIREWIYPDREEVTALLQKACALDAVPVLVCRRYAYSTYSVLNRCGVILHQTFNQLYPRADAELAATAKDKTLLGYHDIRLGNDPDARLLKFFTALLPDLIPKARPSFEQYHDLLAAYGSGEMNYVEFAGRALRRSRGENEDGFDADSYAEDHF